MTIAPQTAASAIQGGLPRKAGLYLGVEELTVGSAMPRAEPNALATKKVPGIFKCGDLIEVLFWDGQGLCLFAKRLECGRVVWP